MIKKILLAITLAIALSIGIGSAAEAKPPKQGGTYNYTYVTLTDRDGTTSSNNHFYGTISYDGTGSTTCVYSKGDLISSSTPNGFYTVPYVIPDTSREGVKKFCSDHFVDRSF